ncbi:MAG: hypothetical protein FJ395_19310 [Verrucomicrobia bacterium]|nr:hypothetical protein [Verrucomicrobiota bacterium]
MTPVDKLVKSIEQALGGGVSGAGGEKLAAEYAQWCATANKRLDQCERLLDGKAEYEALQSAETPPSLLDLCAALSFEKAGQWRDLCRSRSWAQAEELNERAISALNDLYGKGITTAHPLYRDYRRAVVEHDDARALSVLQTIVRLNPGDVTAQQEKQRLLGKVRGLTIGRLEQALQRQDVPAVQQTLEEIEAAGWTSEVNRTVLEQAQAIRREIDRKTALNRCLGLVEWLDRLKQQNAWEEALAPVQEIEQLCAGYDLVLAEEPAQAFAAVRDWARALKQQDDDEKRFQAALRNVEFHVEKGQADSAPGAARTLQSLREEQHVLLNLWRELEGFAKAVPEDLQARVQRRNGVLQAEISRLVRQRRLLTTISVAALVVVTSIAAVVLFRWHWTKGQIADLVKLRQERKVTTTEKLIADLRHNDKKAIGRSQLVLAIRESEQWVTEEHQRVGRLQTMLGKLQVHRQAGFRDAPVEDILRELQQTQAFTKELAPEFRGTGATELLEFENQFDSILQTRQRQMQTEFLALLKTAEQQAAIFDKPDLNTPVLRKAVSDLAESVSRLETVAQPIHERLRLPESLTGRVAPLKAKVVPYQQALVKLDAAETEMKQAVTLEQYYAALEKYDAEHVRQLPAIRAARRAASTKLTALEVERAMLMPEDAEGWQALIKGSGTSALPTEVMPAELSKWLSLRDDENLQNVYLYQLPETEDGVVISAPPARGGRVFTRGPWRRAAVDSLGLRFSAMAFIPAKEATKAEFTETNFLCKCNRNKPLQQAQLDMLGSLCPESSVIKRIGLDTWINDAGDKFRCSLLPILDELRASDSASVVLKAFIHWRLLEILAIRPAVWGVQRVPAIGHDQAALKELGISDLRSGDWMVPLRVQQYEAKLAEFYQKTREVSYSSQARFMEQLLSDTHADGFKFAGYVAADGTPILTKEGGRALNLWGQMQDGLKLTWLWKNQTASGNPKASAAQAQPFSPLFCCGREPDELLRAVAEKQKLEWQTIGIKDYLPPLFQEKRKP